MMNPWKCATFLLLYVVNSKALSPQTSDCRSAATAIDIAFLIDMSTSLVSNTTNYEQMKETILKFAKEANLAESQAHIGIYPFAATELYADENYYKQFIFPLYSTKFGNPSDSYSYDKISEHLYHMSKLKDNSKMIQNTHIRPVLEKVLYVDVAKSSYRHKQLATLWRRDSPADTDLKLMIFTDGIISDLRHARAAMSRVRKSATKQMETSVILVGDDAQDWSSRERSDLTVRHVERADSWTELNEVIKENQIFLDLCNIKGGWNKYDEENPGWDICITDWDGCQTKKGLRERKFQCNSPFPDPMDEVKLMCVDMSGEPAMEYTEEEVCDADKEELKLLCADESFCVMPEEEMVPGALCYGAGEKHQMERDPCYIKFLETKAAVAYRFTAPNNCTFYGKGDICGVTKDVPEGGIVSPPSGLKRVCVRESERVSFILDSSDSALAKEDNTAQLLEVFKKSVSEFVKAMHPHTSDTASPPEVAIYHFNNIRRTSLSPTSNLTQTKIALADFRSHGPTVGGETNIQTALTNFKDELKDTSKRHYVIVLTAGDFNEDLAATKRLVEEIENSNAIVLFFGYGEKMKDELYVNQLKSLTTTHMFTIPDAGKQISAKETARHIFYLRDTFLTTFCESCNYHDQEWTVTEGPTNHQTTLNPAPAKRYAGPVEHKRAMKANRRHIKL